MPTVGTVVLVKSRNPRTIVVQPPGEPAPDPVIFNQDVTLEDLTVATAAWQAGRTVAVDGTPPSCAGVKAP